MALADLLGTVGDGLEDCVVGLYFSAHWCPPCRQFTPQLAGIYDQVNAAGKRFEVVFVSSDQDQAGFDQYFASMPWRAVPFADRAKRDELSRLYSVRGIPALILLDSDGTLITADGRATVAQDPSGSSWLPGESRTAISNPWTDAPLNVANCEGTTAEIQTGARPMVDELAALRRNSGDVLTVACKTLRTLLKNVLANPESEQYRTIHLSNKAIQQRVLQAEGGKELLVAAGFFELPEEQVLVLLDAENLDSVRAALGAVEQAMVPQAAAEQPVNSERSKYLAELKAKKQKAEREKAALRERIALQRQEQENRTVRDSNAVLLKGRTKGTMQSATQMGLDGKGG